MYYKRLIFRKLYIISNKINKYIYIPSQFDDNSKYPSKQLQVGGFVLFVLQKIQFSEVVEQLIHLVLHSEIILK